MKYFVILLVLAAVSGCTVYHSDNPAIDPASLPDIKSGPYALPYAMVMAEWEPSLHPDGTPDKFARDVYTHTATMDLWKYLKDTDPETPTLPALDAMHNIVAAGFLREAIWVKHQSGFSVRPEGLNLSGFKQWIDDNPELLINANTELVELAQPIKKQPDTAHVTKIDTVKGPEPVEAIELSQQICDQIQSGEIVMGFSMGTLTCK